MPSAVPIANPAAPPKQVLPWTALVAVAIAMVCDWFSLGPNPLLPTLAIALVPTYFVTARITARWLAWLIGLAAVGVIVGQGWFSLGQNPVAAIEPQSAQMYALISLAGLVLLCWVRQTSPGALGIAIFLSGLAFLLGCTTWDDTFIRFAAPAYMAFAILSFPAFRGVQAADRDHRAAEYALRGFALVVALAIGGGVYSVFWTYRSQLTEFGDHFLQNKHMPEEAGISSNPVLGDSFGLQGSPIRVLKIVGPLGDPHLRGLAFDTYYMGAWQGGIYSAPLKMPTRQDLGSDAPGPRAQVTCLADSAGIVYAPLNSAGIDLGAAEQPAVWAPESGAAIRTHAAPPFQYAIVENTSPYNQGPLCVPPDPLTLARDSAVPLGVDPGVRRLALSIGGKLSTPEAKIQAVTDYLLTHYTYSLTIHPGPGDPVSNFLLHKKAAYCEYFGSAAVILLRYLGVPSRYVVGYYAHESDGPSTTVVRQWDAHAWAEAWVDGVGWVTVDATPADGRPDQLDHHVPFWTRVLEWLQDREAAWRAKLARLSRVQIAEIVAGVALAAFLIRWLWQRGWRVWQRRRARQAAFRYSQADPDIARLAARFEAFLARSGLACPSEATWLDCIDLARSAEPKPSIDIDTALEFIEQYNSARFGEQTSRAAIDRLRETLETLEGTKR